MILALKSINNQLPIHQSCTYCRCSVSNGEVLMRGRQPAAESKDCSTALTERNIYTLI